MDGRITKGGKSKGGGKPKLAIVPQPSEVVVSLARGQGKDINGLTSKQEAFAQGVGARGETLAAAYRAAYDAGGMSQAAIHVAACRLMDNAAVALRVNALVQARQAKSSHDAARIRSYVIERLHVEASDTNNPPSVRVRAIELLGKLGDVGAFVERTATEAAPSSQGELAATLEARLRAVMAKTG